MEKFAFLNLLKELDALSRGTEDEKIKPCAEDSQNSYTKAKPKTIEEGNKNYNVLVSVMERHEAAAYRIKNKNR